MTVQRGRAIPPDGRVAAPALDAAVKPVLSPAAITRQLTTSWGGGDTDTRSWAGASLIAYALPDAAPTNAPGVPPEAAGIVALTPHQKAAAELAFTLWDDLIPQSLVETGSPSADIVLDASSLTQGSGTYTETTLVVGADGHDRIASGQIWLNSAWASNQDQGVVPGSYGFLTDVHEIGHSLGLSHPSTYDAAAGRTPTFAADGAYDRDQRRYTVMSYFGGYDPTSRAWASDGTGAGWVYPETPMVDDVAAIQSLYGADTATRTGNTTYGFDCSLAADDPERAIYDFTRNPTPVFTIWDAGGTDTLDCSGYGGRQVIDLTPGAYSSVDGLTDNVAIAYGCRIEVAVGGGGDDLLVSGAGGDTLTGGAGHDRFAGSVATLGGDTLTDFSAADTIDITDLAYSADGAGATDCRYDSATHLLTVGQAGGPACTLALAGSFAGLRFTAGSDGAGGTAVTLAPAPALAVGFDPATAGFRDGRTPILTGSVAAPIGPASVELFDGDPAAGGRDLGAATVAEDGTWRFSADLGAGHFGAITAVATDGTGAVATATAPFDLATALLGLPYRAIEHDHGADGSERFVAYGRRGAVLASGDGADGIALAAAAGQPRTTSLHGDAAGPGAERFVFDPSPGHAAVTGFSIAGPDPDILDLAASPFRTLAQVLNHTDTIGGDAILHLNPQVSLAIVGVTKAELRAHPEVFALAG